MNTLHNILVFIVLATSIISGISYSVRKSDSRKALETLKETDKPSRQATEMEMEEAYSAYGMRPESSDVITIRGPWNRHGISTNSKTVWHQLIGEIEVKEFPGWDSLVTDDNIVEIVSGPKNVGLPLTFNGTPLSDAMKKQLRTSQLEQAFRSGEATDVAVTTPDPVEKDALEIYARRDETSAEASLRARWAADGTMWTVLVWTGLFLLTCGVSVYPDASMTLIIIGIAIATASGWYLRKKLKKTPDGTPVQLRSLRGPLTFNARIDTSTDTAAAKLQPYMGELKVEYPPHWLPGVVLAGAGRADIDVDLHHRVVRHGRLSLYDELQRFPVVRWGWHIAGMIGAASVALVAVFIAFPLDDAFSQASTRLFGHTRDIRATAPAQFQSQRPALGDWVRIGGTAQCLSKTDKGISLDADAFETLSGDSERAPNCKLLGWNATTVPLTTSPTLTPEETALVDLSASLSNVPRRSPYSAPDYNALVAQILGGISARNIGDLNVLVQQLDHVCTDDLGTDEACLPLRAGLSALADLDGRPWQEVLDKAKAGGLSKSLSISLQDAGLLRDLLDGIVSKLQRRAALKAAQAAGASHSPAVILDIANTDEGGLKLSSVSEQKPNAPAAEAQDESAAAGDEFTDASSVRTLLNNQFALKGEIIGVSRDQNGALHLRVRAQAQPVATMTIVGPLVLLLISLIALIAHIVAFRRARAQRASRLASVTADVSRQLF